MLADNQSTDSIFCNKDYVHAIRKAKQQLDLDTNGGRLTTTLQAKVPGFDGRVWFDEDAITNIFAFHQLVQQYPITYDSQKEDAFIVHKKDGTTIKFIKAPNGLYFYIPPDAFVQEVHQLKQQEATEPHKPTVPTVPAVPNVATRRTRTCSSLTWRKRRFSAKSSPGSIIQN